MTAIEKGDLEKALVSQGKEISLIQANLSEPHQLGVTIRTSFLRFVKNHHQNIYLFCLYLQLLVEENRADPQTRLNFVK